MHDRLENCPPIALRLDSTHATRNGILDSCGVANRSQPPYRGPFSSNVKPPPPICKTSNGLLASLPRVKNKRRAGYSSVKKQRDTDGPWTLRPRKISIFFPRDRLPRPCRAFHIRNHLFREEGWNCITMETIFLIKFNIRERDRLKKRCVS